MMTIGAEQGRTLAYREKKLRPYFFQCIMSTSLIPEPGFSLLAAARIDSHAKATVSAMRRMDGLQAYQR
jgi:hypothetical protein